MARYLSDPEKVEKNRQAKKHLDPKYRKSEKRLVWLEANAERIREIKSRWKKNNPLQTAKDNATRRARLEGAAIEAG